MMHRAISAIMIKVPPHATSNPNIAENGSSVGGQSMTQFCVTVSGAGTSSQELIVLV